MKAIKTQIGRLDVLIEVEEVTLVEPIGRIARDNIDEGRNTVETSLAESLSTAYSQAKHVILEVAQDFGNQLQSFEGSKPQKVEISFSLKLSSEGSLWVVSCSGEGSLGVKLTWETL